LRFTTKIYLVSVSYDGTFVKCVIAAQNNVLSAQPHFRRTTGVFSQRGRIAPGPHRHPSSLSENIATFWETIDGLWGIRHLPNKGAAWFRHGFLTAFTAVISEHRNFWLGQVCIFLHIAKLEIPDG
jgi:hypothetical protein